MYRQQILELIEKCQVAEGAGLSLNDIRFDSLPELIKPLLESPEDFLGWIKEDLEYSYFYFDVQESGVCAKPVEAVAMILEAIVIDALENKL
jgi:hypothetical protein